ncbi:MAG: Fur family transcriptional regulator [Candidatus Woesearchaeota archaeon]
MEKYEFRLTNQRMIILDYLKNNHEHPSVEDIFGHVRKKLPRVSKKTIYNNLQFLRNKGMINEVEIKGVQRYEPRSEQHHHLICRRCGKIIDMRSDGLLSHAIEVGNRIKDFDVDTTHVNFYGICKRCKEGNENGRRK